MDADWNLDNHDKLKLIEVTEDSLLDIVATSTSPFEPLPIIRDEEINVRNRGKIMATLMILKNKGKVKSDEFGLKWTITWKGRLDRLYRYKGWAAVTALIALATILIGYFAWVHPFTPDESKPPEPKIKAGSVPPEKIVLKRSNADSIRTHGQK